MYRQDRALSLQLSAHRVCYRHGLTLNPLQCRSPAWPVLTLYCPSWKCNGPIFSGKSCPQVCSLFLPAPPPPFTPPPLALPLPKWLLEHQECKCSRQCHLPRYFRSSMDVFLWTFSCIKLHRAMLWLEVVDLMFPSVGFYFFVWKEEFITWSSAVMSPVRQRGIALHGSGGEICKSDPILRPLARK